MQAAKSAFGARVNNNQERHPSQLAETAFLASRTSRGHCGSPGFTDERPDNVRICRDVR